MNPSALSHAGHVAIDLNGSSNPLHWSFIYISVANLIVIAVMVLIFGAALLIRFPHAEGGEVPPEDVAEDPVIAAAAPAPGDEGMGTAKVRTWTEKVLPPRKLLPDRQPAYVASWIYVFGVASLVALGIVIVSGFGLALGGSDWWHTNAVGHFFNSVHLWSVELFMAFLVIHLWGKFWMAAWRGRRQYLQLKLTSGKIAVWRELGSRCCGRAAGWRTGSRSGCWPGRSRGRPWRRSSTRRGPASSATGSCRPG